MSGDAGEVEETPQQRAMVDLAVNKLADYQKRWLPVQKQLAAQISSMGPRGSATRRRARGAASTDIEANFSRARAGLDTGAANTGAFGSSKHKLAVAGMGEDQGTSLGLGLTQAEQQIDDAYVSGLGTIMALGQGQQGQAIQSLSRSADMSGRQAQADAAASLDARMGDAALAGQLVGTGFGLYGSMPKGGGLSVDPNGLGVLPGDSSLSATGAGIHARR